ncbi:hypothetical protein [Streptomyces sp. MMG1121]|uniref:MmyB family transcriptional regulator n=1 Tax=Streptomyces sp. MMG1121 TaxID=1415544 RepID=UPI0006AE193A|nr:hypothetical protein [Streptomyces sp. MMG1121]KOV60228.1 hypothetical protein ADK64_31800 [Streptomyces sp. MMG1121]
MASPEFATLWAAQDVALLVTREFRVYGNPAVGQIVYWCTTLAVTATPETYINVYTPADDISRERVEWLLAHPEAIPAPAHTLTGRWPRRASAPRRTRALAPFRHRP